MKKRSKRFFVDVMQIPSEVTGTLILVIVTLGEKIIKFIVDCGFFQESEYEDKNKNFPFNASEIEFAIVTHLHMDHIGRLPLLRKKGFSGKIYMTNINSKLIPRTLQSCSKIVKRNCRRKGEPILYTSDDVDETIALIEGCEYNQSLKINDNITISFNKNGHLPGAASIHVQISCPEEDDINLFFSGDYHGKNLFFRVPTLSKKITKLPMNIIMESTYGYVDSTCIKEVFVKNVLSALRKQKTIVVPVFSLGRAQEVLYYLKKMQTNYPKIFKDVQIYYDGKLSLYYTDAFSQLIRDNVLKFYKNKRNFLPDNLVRVENTIIRKQVFSDSGCKIIVTTSGSGSFGSAQTYISKFISDSNSLIHFTGYCSEGTLGYRLKTAEKGDLILVGGEEHVKMADIQFTNEFSKHAKADEIIKLLNCFDNPVSILLNHGADSTKDMLSERVSKEVNVESMVGILGREYFYRIYPDKTVEAHLSKF